MGLRMKLFFFTAFTSPHIVVLVTIMFRVFFPLDKLNYFN